MDFVGGKIYDAVSVGTTLTRRRLSHHRHPDWRRRQPVRWRNPCSLGCIERHRSPTTPCSQVAARYTIGPWKFYGGYEHIRYANPNNPLAPGAFAQGGYNLGACAINNNNFTTDKNLNVFWVGVKYAVTPTWTSWLVLRHQRVRLHQAPVAATSFANVPVARTRYRAAQQAACAANSASQSTAPAVEDMVSVVVDWRFARHVDIYAGVMWSQAQNGLASGFALGNNGRPTPASRQWSDLRQQGLVLRSRRRSSLPVLMEA